MKFDTLGDWCKWLEKNFSPEIMIPTLPTIIRLDGNNFHSWTKGLDRPFDSNLTSLMQHVTKHLVEHTNAIVGYTQSDEITLILHTTNRKSDIYNAGKKQKILSKLTAECVLEFNRVQTEFLDRPYKAAKFDCRIYQTPTLQDACAQLLWRENDATKNSVSMLAQSHFSHKELQNLNGNQMQDKLMLEKNMNWNDLPDYFKRGSYFKRVERDMPFTKEQLAKLPDNHPAVKDPTLTFRRRVVERVIWEPLTKVDNIVELIFDD